MSTDAELDVHYRRGNYIVELKLLYKIEVGVKKCFVHALHKLKDIDVKLFDGDVARKVPQHALSTEEKVLLILSAFSDVKSIEAARTVFQRGKLKSALARKVDTKASPIKFVFVSMIDTEDESVCSRRR